MEESDKGTYQCRAQNREDSVDVSATVDVQVPPKVIQSASNVYAYEKEDVDLPCKISGRPQPTVQWYKNGERIIEGDYFQVRVDLKVSVCKFINPCLIFFCVDCSRN